MGLRRKAGTGFIGKQTHVPGSTGWEGKRGGGQWPSHSPFPVPLPGVRLVLVPSRVPGGSTRGHRFLPGLSMRGKRLERESCRRDLISPPRPGSGSVPAVPGPGFGLLRIHHHQPGQTFWRASASLGLQSTAHSRMHRMLKQQNFVFLSNWQPSASTRSQSEAAQTL